MKVTVEQLRAALSSLASEQRTTGKAFAPDGIVKALNEWKDDEEFLAWIRAVIRRSNAAGHNQESIVASAVAMGFILADRIHETAKLEEIAK